MISLEGNNHGPLWYGGAAWNYGDLGATGSGLKRGVATAGEGAAA